MKVRAVLTHKAGNRCAVCRTRPIAQFHHIDQNNANSVEGNLIGLCTECHADAHADQKMRQNLTPDRLHRLKQLHEADISIRAVEDMIPSDFGSWTYLNHDKLLDLFGAYSIEFDQTIFDQLQKEGAINSVGIPQPMRNPADHVEFWTVYNQLPHHVGRHLHHLYTEALDRFIRVARPTDLEALWSRTGIKAMVRPGSICFMLRNFFFKSYPPDDRAQERLVYHKRKKIKLEFRINTRHMSCDSALYASFTGHTTAAALFLVKSVDVEDGVMVIHATALAMGAGFLKSEDTPYPREYRYHPGMDEYVEEDWAEEAHMNEGPTFPDIQ
jgi:hypothetical protein